MSPTPGALLDAVRGQRDEMLALLEGLVGHESPSSVPESQGPVFALLEESLDAIGYETRRLRGEHTGGQLLAAPRGSSFGGVEVEAAMPSAGRAAGESPPAIAVEGSVAGRPLQLLLGHCDTVWPVGTLREMPLRIDDETVRGPGVFDMKAGLVQTVFALRTLRLLELEPTVLPLLFISSDEEIGSPESGDTVVRLARSASRVFVMEPALGPSGKLKTGRKGVGQFVVEIFGRAAHAGLDPEAGASAILELSHQVQRLFDLNEPANGVSVNVGIVDGGMRPNVVAPQSRAIVDVRVPDAVAAARITASVRALTPATQGVRIEVSGGIDRPPMERTPRNQALWRLASRAACDLGLRIEEGIAGGGSDGNLTSPFAATLDGLGAVGDGAHAVHEHIDVPRCLERCALLASLLMEEDVATDDQQ